jgi:hypothetical protein
VQRLSFSPNGKSRPDLDNVDQDVGLRTLHEEDMPPSMSASPMDFLNPSPMKLSNLNSSPMMPSNSSHDPSHQSAIKRLLSAVLPQNGRGTKPQVVWDLKPIHTVSDRQQRRLNKEFMSGVDNLVKSSLPNFRKRLEEWCRLDPEVRAMVRQVALLESKENLSPTREETTPFQAPLKEVSERHFKDQILPAALDGSNDELRGALIACVREMKLKEEQIRSSILGEEVTPSMSDSFGLQYPTLWSYFVPNDPQVHENLLRDLSRLNQARTGSRTLKVNLGNNMVTSFVPVPVSKDLTTLKRNNRKYNFLAEIIKGTNKESLNSEHSRRTFVGLLCESTEFRDIIREVSNAEGLCLIEPLDVVTSFAMTSECNLNVTQVKLLRRLLNAHYGNPIFASMDKTYRRLGQTCVLAETRVYQEGRTKTPYSVKKVDEVLTHYLLELAESGKSFEHADLSIAIDHGKGYLRATAVIVARKKGHKIEEYEDFFNVASAKCKGDSYEILKSTFADDINAALYRIKESGIVSIWRPSSDNKAYARLGDVPDSEGDILISSVTVENWISGDLKFFMMATCREAADRYWCFYCLFCKASWTGGKTNGVCWTNAELLAHLESLKNSDFSKLTVQQRKGLKKCHTLLFDAVDIDHYVPPILHIMLGLVNAVWKNLLAEVQAGFESYTDDYILLEEQMFQAKEESDEAKTEVVEYERWAGNWKIHQQNQLLLPVEERDSAMSDFMLLADLEDCKHELANRLKKSKAAKEKYGEAKDAFQNESKAPENSKLEGQPVRDTFEEFVKRFHITFADFHGREMQGPACRRLLEHRDEIITDFKEYILLLPNDQKREKDDDATEEMFELHRQLLGHIDACISFLRTKRFRLPIDSPQVAIAEKHEKRLHNLWTYLKLSETPKEHINHAHAIPMWLKHHGYGDLGEDLGELAHQVETRNERRVQGIVNFNMKELSKAKYESMVKRPTVKVKVEQLLKQRKRTFIKAGRETGADLMAEKQALRTESRDLLLGMPFMYGEYETLRKRKACRYTENM